MPLYEYQCDQCGHRFERIQKFSDPLVSECPKCGGAVQKLVSSPAFQFKGSGWYATDYAKKSDAPKSDAGSDGKPSESKDAKESKDSGSKDSSSKESSSKDSSSKDSSSKNSSSSDSSSSAGGSGSSASTPPKSS